MYRASVPLQWCTLLFTFLYCLTFNFLCCCCQEYQYMDDKMMMMMIIIIIINFINIICEIWRRHGCAAKDSSQLRGGTLSLSEECQRFRRTISPSSTLCHFHNLAVNVYKSIEIKVLKSFESQGNSCQSTL